MRTSCCIGLCLLMASYAISQEWADYFKPNSEEKIASWKADFKDAEKLKEALKQRLILGHIFPDNNNIPAFKEKFGVTDESIRSALKSIYEAPDKAVFFNSVEAMCAFADERMKPFLLEAATDRATQPGPRQAAIWKYLRLANAEEVKNFFVIILMDKTEFSNDMKDALTSLPNRDADEQKREAIIASLRVVAAQEEDWKRFEYWDFVLMSRDKDYALSRQRVELLKKHAASEPADAESHQITTLKDRLAEIQTRATFTNVSTNLTDLIKRDFRKKE